ncbi:unnamed protein product [Moneuplotes crassus]|uniref:Uncharacterized protein n=1 Tax=Euplotes crassus TaxID=5936 RepID=A0AAD1XFT1_EUPCR|nr:unnamed protein product [Moneuplotes crassus]
MNTFDQEVSKMSGHKLSGFYSGHKICGFTKNEMRNMLFFFENIEAFGYKIQKMHGLGYILGDFGPQNICHLVANQITKAEVGPLPLIRLGAQITHPKEGDDVNFWFTSVNYDNSGTASVKDDLEAICYLLIYCINETLPWCSEHGQIMSPMGQSTREIKAICNTNELCYGLPSKVFRYLKYVKSLKSNAEPDYSKCWELLAEQFQSISFRNFLSTSGACKMKMPDDPEASKSKECISYSSDKSLNPLCGKIVSLKNKQIMNSSTNNDCNLINRSKLMDGNKARRRYKRRKVSKKISSAPLNKLGPNPIAPRELIGSSIYQVPSKNSRCISRHSGSISQDKRQKARRYGSSKPQLKNMKIFSVVSRCKSKHQSNSEILDEIDDLTILSAECVTVRRVNVLNPHSSVFKRFC